MLRILCLLILLPFAALAQDLPEPLTDTVSDYADLLPQDAEARVTAALRANRDATGVHMVVVTMEAIADHGGTGQRIEAYGKALFNAWGIGDATKNDGVMILVVRGDRVARIALGSGYDAVYDGRAARVIDTAMIPEFRSDRYAAGIEAGVASAVERIVTPHVKNEVVTETSGFDAPFDPAPYLMFGVFAVGAVLIAFKRRIGDAWLRAKACPTCGKRGLHRTHEVIAAATATVAGQRMETTRCNHCDYRDSRRFDVARRNSKSSGGGFGGGKSSGGGATGRW